MATGLRPTSSEGILRSLLAFRRLLIVRLAVYVLLAWTAVDLLVPQLCNAESFGQSSSQSPAAPQGDDCFCCTLVEDPEPFRIQAVAAPRVILNEVPTDDVAPGFPSPPYHPPLAS